MLGVRDIERGVDVGPPAVALVLFQEGEVGGRDGEGGHRRHPGLGHAFQPRARQY